MLRCNRTQIRLWHNKQIGVLLLVSLVSFPIAHIFFFFLFIWDCCTRSTQFHFLKLGTAHKIHINYEPNTNGVCKIITIVLQAVSTHGQAFWKKYKVTQPKTRCTMYDMTCTVQPCCWWGYTCDGWCGTNTTTVVFKILDKTYRRFLQNHSSVCRHHLTMLLHRTTWSIVRNRRPVNQQNSKRKNFFCLAGFFFLRRKILLLNLAPNRLLIGHVVWSNTDDSQHNAIRICFWQKNQAFWCRNANVEFWLCLPRVLMYFVLVLHHQLEHTCLCVCVSINCVLLNHLMLFILQIFDLPTIHELTVSQFHSCNDANMYGTKWFHECI